MTYSKWITIYNKIVRDTYPLFFEWKWILYTIRIIEDKKELVSLLSDKLHEEICELQDALHKQNKKEICEEIADIQEVIISLKKILWTIEWHDKSLHVMQTIKDTENKIDIYTAQNKESIHEIQKTQQEKYELKWWFEKWIFLISTDS